MFQLITEEVDPDGSFEQPGSPALGEPGNRPLSDADCTATDGEMSSRECPLTEIAVSGRAFAPDPSSDDASAKPLRFDQDAEVLPVLNRQCFQKHLADFVAEHRPHGPTEYALVRDLARQRAAVDRWGEAAEAVERTAARQLPGLAGIVLQDDAVGADAVLAGAMATDAAYQCERHSLARSRAFCRVLDKLQNLQSQRLASERLGVVSVPPAFASEAACEAYLANRLRNEVCRCGKCGKRNGCFLPSRQVWECGACRAHTGLRTGTVMAGSPLPLLVWFGAIRMLLWRPTTGTADLAEQVGLRRKTTVRTLVRRIREAMGAEDASALLAGLDRHFARAAGDLSKAGTRTINERKPVRVAARRAKKP